MIKLMSFNSWWNLFLDREKTHKESPAMRHAAYKAWEFQENQYKSKLVLNERYTAELKESNKWKR